MEKNFDEILTNHRALRRLKNEIDSMVSKSRREIKSKLEEFILGKNVEFLVFRNDVPWAVISAGIEQEKRIERDKNDHFVHGVLVNIDQDEERFFFAFDNGGYLVTSLSNIKSIKRVKK